MFRIATISLLFVLALMGTQQISPAAICLDEQQTNDSKRDPDTENSRVIYMRGSLTIDANLAGVSIEGSETRLSYDQAPQFLEKYCKQKRPSVVYFWDSEKAINESAETLLRQVSDLANEHKFHVIVMPPPMGSSLPGGVIDFEELISGYIETGKLTLPASRTGKRDRDQ